MLEVLFWFGWAGLFAGVMVGWMRLTDLMVHAATAGAAALVVFALQAMGPVEAWRFGASAASAELVTLLYIEVVSLAVLGWMFARWRMRAGE
jgi:hypothetical protein